jgi:hypothetical protein
MCAGHAPDVGRRGLHNLVSRPLAASLAGHGISKFEAARARLNPPLQGERPGRYRAETSFLTAILPVVQTACVSGAMLRTAERRHMIAASSRNTAIFPCQLLCVCN